MNQTPPLDHAQSTLAAHQRLPKALVAKYQQTSADYPATRHWLREQINDARRKIAALEVRAVAS